MDVFAGGALVCQPHSLCIRDVLGFGDTREENGNPLQYSCLENPMNRGAWWAAVHSVTQSWT